MAENNPIRSYRDLQVWQLAMELTENVYRSTEGFPKHELYGLVSQMRRAAVSIPWNIAEGHAMESTKEFLRHLSIAVGSQAELETQAILSGRLNYMTSTQVDELLSQAEKIGRMLLASSVLSKRSFEFPLSPIPYPLPPPA